MSDHRHILDAKGRKVALLDGQGNLSREAMTLYLADGLSAEDRTKVDAVADSDPMTRDALDGLLKVPVNHSSAIASMMMEMAERSGSSVLPAPRQSSELPWLRIAAAVVALAVVITIGIMGQRWYSDHQEMADATPPQAIEKIPATEVTELDAEDEPEDITTSEATTDEQPEPVADKIPEPPSAVEQAANTKEKKEIPKAQPEITKPLLKKDVTSDDTIHRTASPSLASSESADADEVASGATARTAQSDTKERSVKPMSYDMVDTPARFPGGDLEMFRFIKLNKNFPEPLKNEGMKGSVLVKFVVNTQGRIENIQLVEGFHPVLDQDALRVVRAMPKWTPAEHQGQKVPVARTVAVQYE